MLRGHSTAKIDQKGRIRIPSEFLDSFVELCGPERRLYLTSRDGRMVLAYPLPVWEEHEQKIAQIPTTDPDLGEYLDAVSYWGREAKIDDAGRIRIHPLLREAATLAGDVSVFGKQHILTLCDHEQYRRKAPVVSSNALTALSKYGL